MWFTFIFYVENVGTRILIGINGRPIGNDAKMNKANNREDNFMINATIKF